MNVTENQNIIDREIGAIVETIYQNRDNDSFYYKGIFNTKDLPDHNNYSHSPNIDPIFQSIIFTKLNGINKHCLYWFELENEEKAATFVNLLNDYRKIEGCKTVPPANKNRNSKVLYLGVRQGGAGKNGLTNIEGRMNQHLGYYKIAKTQGLQLYEYAKGKDFNIVIKVIAFEGIETDCLNVIEKRLANKMKPLSGKH